MSTSERTDECVVTYCDGTGELLSVCIRHHKMHPDCLAQLLEKNHEVSCPMCRDDSLQLMRDALRD